MKTTCLTLALVSLVGCSGNQADTNVTEQPVWTNGDFESDPVGTSPPTGWTLDTYLDPGITDLRPGAQTLASLNLSAGGAAGTEVIGGSPETQIDPDIGGSGTLRYPKYGNRAVRVNKSASVTGTGRNVNQLKQQMTVGLGDVDPTDNKVHVRFAIAPVLENPAHSYTSQPYYFVRLQNLTRGTTVYQDFNASGQPGVPWKDFTDSSGQAAQYTDWQLVDISPGNAALAVGDQVELLVVASGCSAGGHWGRVYVDSVGSGIPGLYTWATGVQQANAGSNIIYTINYKNGGTTTTSGTTLDFVTPPNTTYVSDSGASCTSPGSGSTGTASCSLGSLAPGATGSLTITVNVDAGTTAGSLITNGNYAISASGVSALVGPKVYTTVTSGITYADLRISNTDGVAALGWGQPTTYTIVVTNAGPASSTATVSDPLPAELTGATWTCAATGGGTCTASGSGGISDSVSLPAGATLTYTLNATTIGGSGSGSVVNTASVSATGAATDPDSTNSVAVDTNAIGTLTTLAFSKTGTPSGGRVSSTPQSIDCGVGCNAQSASFLDGTQVVLTAAPVPGATFLGWSGACSGTATTCTVTMAGPLSVSAAFVGAPATVASSSGSTQSTTVSTAFASPLQVLVTDASGTPVSGVTVSFSAPGSGARATLSAASAVTGADGKAQVTATANATSGSYSVTATVSGIATPATFALTNIGVPASVAVSAGGSQSATVGTAFATGLDALVRDASGNPVPGITVTFTAPGSGATAQLSAGTAVTDATGHAAITATAGQTAGSYSVSATVSGVGTPASFALSNLAGAAVALQATAGTPQSATVGTAFGSQLAARAIDTYGNPVAGVAITFGAPASGASAMLATPSATTGSDGTARTTATSGTIAGDFTVTASASGLADVTFSLSSLPGTAQAIAITGGNAQSAIVHTAFAAALSVAVTDQYGNAVPGAPVTFQAPGAGASATVSSTTTDGAGLATSSATANDIAGSYTVSAQLASSASVSFALANTPAAPASVAITNGDAQTTTVGTAFASLVGVRVADAYDNPVPGVAVTLTGPATGAGITGSPLSLTTDAAGHAATSITANHTPGSYTVAVHAAGVATEPALALSNTPGAAATVEVVSGSGQHATVAGTFAAPLVALARDSFGNPVPGTTISFTAPGTAATATLSDPTATADATGQGSVMATASTASGSYQITATIAGGGSTKFTLSNDSDAPASISAAPTASPQQMTVLLAFTAPLAVTVLDQYGNPVPGAPVTYASTGTTASAGLSSASATTDSSGVASVIATANGVAGAYVVHARVAGITDPAAFSLTNLAGAPATLVVAGGAGQSAVVDTDFANTLVVLVLDAEGNPAPNAVVGFSAPAAAATAILDASSVASDATGRASVHAHASTTTGAYSITASLSGTASPVVFGLTNTAAAPATITASPGSTPQNARVGTAFVQPLIATVRDGFDNAVPGATIQYTVPASGATAVLSAATATTASDGRASISATAGLVAGTYQATARVAGVTTPATFSLGNLPGDAKTITVVSGGTQTVTVAAAFAPVTVLIQDAHGNAVPGADVFFAAPSTGATTAVTSASAVTDTNGNASASFTAGTIAGAFTVTATTPSGQAPALLSFTTTAAAPAHVAALAGATPQTAEIEHAFAQPLAVSVEDTFGNRVPGVTVTFTAPTLPGATLSSPTDTTNSSGVASVLAIADSKSGTYTVNVAVAGTPGAAFTLSNSPSAPNAVAMTDGGGQRARALAAYAAPFTMLVVDAFGNPVSGATVELTVPAGSATLSAATATTDDEGVAQVSLVAGAIVGQFELSAHVQGSLGATRASFEVTPIASSITVSAPATSPVDGSVELTIAVTAEAGVPTGTVEVVGTDGTSYGTATLVAGTATISVSDLPRGMHQMLVRYAAQSSWAASTSSTVAFEITDDEGSLSGGGCSTGGAGGSGGMILVAAALLLARRRRAAGAAVLGATALLATTATVRAEPAGARAIDRFHAASPDSAWFGLDSASFGGEREVTMSLLADFARDPLATYNADGSVREHVVSDTLVFHAGASVTLADKYRLSANVPMAAWQDGTGGTYNGMPLSSPTFAFGDVTLAGDVRVYGGPRSPERLVVGVRTQLPTGSTTNFMGDGTLSVEPRIAFAATRAQFEIATSAGAFLRQESEVAGAAFGSELRYAAGAGMRTWDGRLLVGPELSGAVPLTSGSDVGTPLELQLGAHVDASRNLRVGLGASAGLVNAPGQPAWRTMASLVWIP